MTGAGIFDGDPIVADRALVSQEADVAVTVVNGHLAIKSPG